MWCDGREAAVYGVEFEGCSDVHGTCLWHVEIVALVVVHYRATYHASMAHGPHDVQSAGGFRMSARVPGGARGCADQLYLWPWS